MCSLINWFLLFFALQILNMPVEYSDTGFEYLTEADEDTVFVLDNFEGDIFTRLHRAGARIMGPAVLNKCAKNNEVNNTQHIVESATGR